MFTITLDSPAVAGGFNVQVSTANGSAVAPSDFTAITNATVSFAEGESSKNITVVVNGDSIDEGASETFTLNVTSDLNDPSADGTITDDDNPPTVTINDPSVGEAAGAGSFAVTLSNPSSAQISVFWSPSAGVTNPASEGADYTIAPGGTLVFAAGETFKPIAIPFTVVDDTADEPDETFRALLTGTSGPAGAITKTTGTATIVDNDDPAPLPTLSVAPATVSEGGVASVVVTRTGPGGDVTFVLSTGIAGNATPASDFAPLSAQRTITGSQAATATSTIQFTTLQDALDEEDEIFNVILSDVSGAQVGQASANVTITDDDPTPLLSVSGPSTVTEPANGASTALTYTVSLTPASGRTVTVNVATVNGTATAGSDFGAASGSLTFAPGETSKPVPVSVLGDAINEANETFSVALSGAANATLAAGQSSATTTIVDPSAPPALGIADLVTSEGAGTAILTVTLAGSTQQTVTVQYEGQSGVSFPNAILGTDFTLPPGTLTFSPGQTSKTIAVAITDDAVSESDETFTVVLKSPSPAGVTLTKATATVKIVDNDSGTSPPRSPSPPPAPPRNPSASPSPPPAPKPTKIKLLTARVLWTKLDGNVQGRKRAAIRVTLNQKVLGRLVMVQGKRTVRSGQFEIRAGNRTVFVLLPKNIKLGRVNFELLLTTASAGQKVLKAKLVLKAPKKAKKAKTKAAKPKA